MAMDISIHDKLKTEEYARISKKMILSICRTLPRIRDSRKNGQMILFIWYRIRNNGASFCHVIRMKAGVRLEFLVILTNHSWNGEAAIFTSRDSSGKKIRNVAVNFGELEMVILLTRRTEDTD